MRIDDDSTALARQQIGAYLKRTRHALGISQSHIMRSAGWHSLHPVKRIEDGEGYTIDNLLRYLDAIGFYIYFSKRTDLHKKKCGNVA